MTVVHFATELCGGAGGFVRHVHLAMLELGLPSFTVTREPAQLRDCVTVKPLRRVTGSLRARSLTLLGKLGVLDTSYVMFGMEKTPVGLGDLQKALGTRVPAAFIFYWVSYFIDFRLMSRLREAYPGIPFLFVCLDDALLTGGCHYSWGCPGFEDVCGDCPATPLPWLKKRIELRYRERRQLMPGIDPIVIYPTSNMRRMGERSAVLKDARSAVIPLGAISTREAVEVAGSHRRKRAGGKMRLLVRSTGEYRKGCDLLVCALRIMAERMPDLRERLEIVSIGDGTLSEAQISRYLDQVDLGYVGRKELMSIYRDIDAFLVTSREDGGPLMTNECVALGIFVLSTPIGVARDLIREGRNGLIAREASGEAIAQTLTEFVDRREAFVKTADGAEERELRESLTFEGYVRTVMGVIGRQGEL